VLCLFSVIQPNKKQIFGHHRPNSCLKYTEQIFFFDTSWPNSELIFDTVWLNKFLHTDLTVCLFGWTIYRSSILRNVQYQYRVYNWLQWRVHHVWDILNSWVQEVGKSQEFFIVIKKLDAKRKEKNGRVLLSCDREGTHRKRNLNKNQSNKDSKTTSNKNFSCSFLLKARSCPTMKDVCFWLHVVFITIWQ